jgi:hypothetical protein
VLSFFFSFSLFIENGFLIKYKGVNMEIVKYTAKYINGDIILKVFVNGKLKQSNKMTEEEKAEFKQDCAKFNMTIEEGVSFIQRKVNKIQRAFDQQDRELELMSTHNHRHH